MEQPPVNKSWSYGIKIFIWVIIVIGLGFMTLGIFRGEKLVTSDPSAYQAVFLDNSEVYFGKLRTGTKGLWVLSDVYYLRAGKITQGSGEPVNPQEIELIKFGGEIHAPKDEIILNSDHVLYYEDINENSQVMIKIREHKEKK